MNLSREANNELLYVGFNQDSGCFACGTTNGFVIYNVEPFRETFRRVFSNGGIGIVEMLYRCNLIAIVGGGRNPRYPTNKVMIWDDHQNKCIGELMFKSEVYAVRLRRDRVVAVLNTKIFVYRFSDLKLLDQITTMPNPKGLVALCPDSENNVLAVPGLAKGSIRVELYNIAKATLIKAHDTDLSQFALNSDGSKIASSSEKGTLIRLWDTHTGDPLREFRRGMDRAEIYCIAFNTATTYLACSSDKGTVHIFSLMEPNSGELSGDVFGSRNVNNNNSNSNNNNSGQSISTDNASTLSGNSNSMRSTSTSHGTSSVSNPVLAGDMLSAAGDSNSNNNSGNNNNMNLNNNTGNSTVASSNKSMGLTFLRGVLPQNMIPKYINSEWSYAQVRGIEGKSICAFDKENMRIVVVSSDGTFLVSSFEGGGECPRLSAVSFIRQEEDLTHGMTDIKQ